MSADCTDCKRRARRKASRSPAELPAKVAAITRQMRGLARQVAEQDYAGTEALEDLAQLAGAADQLMTAAVARMRDHGYSWADIGRGLGTSRQAAQMNYGPKLARLDKESTT